MFGWCAIWINATNVCRNITMQFVEEALQLVQEHNYHMPTTSGPQPRTNNNSLFLYELCIWYPNEVSCGLLQTCFSNLCPGTKGHVCRSACWRFHRQPRGLQPCTRLPSANQRWSASAKVKVTDRKSELDPARQNNLTSTHQQLTRNWNRMSWQAVWGKVDQKYLDARFSHLAHVNVET